MRLFVAAIPPSSVLDHLAAAVTRVRGGQADLVRWTLPEQWHVSLAFLTEVAEETVPELRRRLGRAARRHGPLTLSVAGAGAFGSPRRARVVWAGLAGDTRPLRDLAWSVAAAARRSGIAIEDRRFRAHLTLGRLREPADLSDLVAQLEPYTGPSWTVGEIELVRSHLGKGEGGRARYEPVATWPLGPKGGGNG